MIRTLTSIGAIQVLILAVSLGRGKFLALTVGPGGYGVIGTIDQVVMSIVHLAGLSLPFTSLKFMSRAHSETNERFRASYASFLWGVGALGIVAVISAITTLALRPTIFGEDLAPHRHTLSLAVLTTPAVMLNIFFVHALAAAQQTATSTLLNLVVTFCLAIAACVGVYVGGADGLYLATAGAGVVTTLSTLCFVGRRLDVRALAAPGGIVAELRRHPEALVVSLMLYVAVSTYSIATLVVRYGVFSQLGDRDAGFLQALFGISLALGAIAGPMNTLFLTPFVNRRIPDTEKLSRTHDFHRKLSLLLAIIVLPATLFPRLVASVLFSPQFAPCAPSLALFLLWQCVYQLVNVYQQLLIGLDDVSYFATTTTIGFVIAGVCAMPMIGRWGLDGAAIALLTGILCNGVLTAVRLRWRYRQGVPRAVLLTGLICATSVVLPRIVFAASDEASVAGVAWRLGYAVGIGAVVWRLLPGTQTAALRQWVLDRLIHRA